MLRWDINVEVEYDEESLSKLNDEELNEYISKLKVIKKIGKIYKNEECLNITKKHIKKAKKELKIRQSIN